MVSLPPPPSIPAPSVVAVIEVPASALPKATSDPLRADMEVLGFTVMRASLVIESEPSPPDMPAARVVADMAPSPEAAVPPKLKEELSRDMLVRAFTVIEFPLVIVSSPSPVAIPVASVTAVVFAPAEALPKATSEPPSTVITAVALTASCPWLSIVSEPSPPEIPTELL